MPESNHLLLVGGGHAHVAVLADWIKRGLPCEKASLLTPNRYLRYSGTVPGWIAGQYDRDVGLVDLVGLAKRAGVEFVQGRCSALDPEERDVTTQNGARVTFDLASLDTGGIGRASEVLGNDPRLLDIRPIDRFVEQLEGLDPATRIAVLGGGAGGVELALALRNRNGAVARPHVTLVTGGPGLLPVFSPAVRKRVGTELVVQGIALVTADARFEDGRLRADGASLEPVDLIVAALGSGAPEWVRASGLACDKGGFVAVDRHQRSISHPHMFAVGDIAARQDRDLPHSGVHAVFAGPVLAANLRAVLAGEEPKRSYRPRWNNLYLMSTGDGRAIASYGPLTASGRWVSRLKHAIDMRWLRKYDALVRGTD